MVTSLAFLLGASELAYHIYVYKIWLEVAYFIFGEIPYQLYDITD